MCKLDLRSKTRIVVSERFAVSWQTTGGVSTMIFNGLSLGTSWIEQFARQLCVALQVGSQIENGDCCFRKVCCELADKPVGSPP